mgnify:CR=1 FL=1
MLDSSEKFSFSGVTIWFTQKLNKGFTVFKPLEAYVEIISQTKSTTDPGSIFFFKKKNYFQKIFNKISKIIIIKVESVILYLEKYGIIELKLFLKSSI